ncbi:MAG: hypothetical protein FJ076_02330 [Cyanobacteria bacterium K_DeepCast_35m_m1_288]|nr:hypothetical protein [Cyanobacteria bacterium K_DeepCast_35m_m1_288]
MSRAVLVATPRGSTIETADNGQFWACDRDHHCRAVNSLWSAQQMIRRAELLRCPIDALSVDCEWR